MSHARRQICGANAQQLLPRVQCISVFVGEGAGGGYAFDVSKQQAAGGQRNYSFNIAQPERRARDRKSTRLNSSHLGISYAVFCLKKKKKKHKNTRVVR